VDKEAEPLAMTVHSLPLAVVDERARRTIKGRLQMALILLVCAAPVIASYLAVYVVRPERERDDKVWLVTDGGPLSSAMQQALGSAGAVQVLRLAPHQVQAWLKPAAGHAVEDHLYVVDPMGEWMMRVPADPDPAKVKRDLDRLLRASASWDTPGR
jgi:hypothetical protein